VTWLVAFFALYLVLRAAGLAWLVAQVYAALKLA
jgi:hypothetical protein